jgi:hypothetical protein
VDLVIENPGLRRGGRDGSDQGEDPFSKCMCSWAALGNLAMNSGVISLAGCGL